VTVRFPGSPTDDWLDHWSGARRPRRPALGVFRRATWLRHVGDLGLRATLAPRTIEGIEYDSFLALRNAPGGPPGPDRG
jgi:hypothetical protein